MNNFHIARKKLYRFGALGKTGNGGRLLSPDWGQTLILNFLLRVSSPIWCCSERQKMSEVGG